MSAQRSPSSLASLEWLVTPWIEDAPLAARAARIGAVAGALTAILLPSMLLFFGPSDWWWDTTLAVCLLIPCFMIFFDEVAHRTGRLLGRRVDGLARMAVLLAGLTVGHVAGYAVSYAVNRDPTRTLPIMAADFRRNMGIILPAVLVCWLGGASSWHRLQSLRLEGAAARAGFDALKGQMQPHFLFNSLNALKELITDDPDLARDFAQRLADLYRLILRVSTSPTAPLADELAIVEHYLEVEHVRFGDRLRYSIVAPDETRGLHVPTLMLQTLAENAVKHGIAKSRAGGQIRVCATRVGTGELELEVSNTGAPFAPANEDETAIAPSNAAPRTGLANTRARLAMMYGAGARLTVTADEELGTRVRFNVSGLALT
ncbi:MAG: histidine kinase [Polyangiaceae bacterium]